MAYENKATPKPRQNRKRAEASEAQLAPQEVSTTQTTEPVEEESTTESRVLKEGESIDVNTDDNGLATETVYQERSIPNSKSPIVVQVAAKGVRYNG